MAMLKARRSFHFYDCKDRRVDVPRGVVFAADEVPAGHTVNDWITAGLVTWTLRAKATRLLRRIFGAA